VPAGVPDSAPATGDWYSYAVVRVVPHVERGEFINAGVVLFARTKSFLEARIELDATRLNLLAPDASIEELQRHLDVFQRIAAGDPDAGSIAGMSQSERFHWLTSPRSTVIQTSPVHVGRCDDPEAALDDLLTRLVRRAV
jgi:hypothetical protein